MTPSHLVLALTAIVASTLAGCSLPVLPTDQDDRLARQVIDDVRRGDDAALDKVSGPEMKTDTARANLPHMKAYFPAAQPLSVKRGAWRSNANIGHPPVLVLEEDYDYPDRTLAITVTMSGSDAEGWMIRGVNVTSNFKPAPSSSAPAKPAAN